ncbi:hypothetical protein ZIOFF_031726 [Zingiber officinale]|uniref:Alliinase C-terminal domain-containing protein n=1 Tax=Zingiber officinale TaxID=94328 RepID=A0A8J5GME8_ZINOF|nr:hypothetical protein ZIOFF_031726 [Zingiber officinale]
MSFLNLAVSFPSSTSTMAEEGKIAPSDPQLEMPSADDFDSQKPQCINLLCAEFVGDKTKETVFAILIVFDGMVVDMRFVYSVHCLVGNAIADNHFVIVGTCSTQLLQAALYALFPPNTPGPLSSVSAVPYYSVSSITCNA